MTTIEDVKSKLDLKSFVEGQGVVLKRAGRLWKGCCPFHNEKSASFFVYPDGHWHCFGSCGEGGDVITFIQRKQNCGFAEALEIAAGAAGVTLDTATTRRSAKYARLYAVLSEAAQYFHAHLTQEARQYLSERGLSESTIERWQFGVALNKFPVLNHLRELGFTDAEMVDAGVAYQGESRVLPRFRARLIIPIWDSRGRVVGFAGRALDEHDQPKYLNSPETALFKKGSLLFGLHNAIEGIKASGQAVVVEGYLDVIAAHQAGFTNVVAQMGSALSAEQISQIAPRYTNQIVLALDGDAAGSVATSRTLLAASDLLKIDAFAIQMRVAELPSGMDPDQIVLADPTEWAQLIDNAMNADQYLIASLMVDEAASLESRKEQARRILPFLDSKDTLTRHERYERLAERLQLPVTPFVEWAEQERIPPLRLLPKSEHFTQRPETPSFLRFMEEAFVISAWENPSGLLDAAASVRRVLNNEMAEISFDELITDTTLRYWLSLVIEQPGEQIVADWPPELCQLISATTRAYGQSLPELTLALYYHAVLRAITETADTLEESPEDVGGFTLRLVDLGRQRVRMERLVSRRGI